MGKQTSFSNKPIRFLVFSFTIFFSLLFLVYFSAWVIHTIPSRPLGAPNLSFNATDFTVQSLEGFESTSSEYVLKNPNLIGDGAERDVNSSQAAGISSYMGALERERERERGITTVTVEESKERLLTGNSSLTTFGKNLSIYSVDSKVDSGSSDDGLQEKKYIINAVVDESNSENQGGTASEISIEKRDTDTYTSIRKNIDEKNGAGSGCDITKGIWVMDESDPLYTSSICPYIDEGFNCEGNGRRDKDYMKWRWQPQDCDVPRFNATKMLELLRGKRLVFVGDSINRNQWESMLCLLIGGIKDPKKVYETRKRKITKEKGNYCFKFEEYKCTVEYYVSHFLVHESKARVGSKRVQTLRIDTIDKGSSRWRGADILVFNTAHWWNHHKTKAGVNYYQEGNLVHPRLDATEGFRRSLLTWASWVNKYINPHKTQIFFRTSAPSHFSGGLWNTGGHCKEALRPINGTFTPTYPKKNLIVEEVINRMKNPVIFLNITQLSYYRPDAHPSIYGRRSMNPGIQDCSHWCLPGVPDTWNELLFHNLLLRTGNA